MATAREKIKQEFSLQEDEILKVWNIENTNSKGVKVSIFTIFETTRDQAFVHGYNLQTKKTAMGTSLEIVESQIF